MSILKLVNKFESYWKQPPSATPLPNDVGPYWFFGVFTGAGQWYIIDHSGGSYFNWCESYTSIETFEDMLLEDIPLPQDPTPFELWYFGGSIHEISDPCGQGFWMVGSNRPATEEEYEKYYPYIQDIRDML